MYNCGYCIKLSFQCSVGDFKRSQESMQETFYLTNILPQDYDNNGGFWYRMENYCRALTNRFSDVYVISGPLFLSHNMRDKKMVTFQVIKIFSQKTGVYKSY